MRLAIADPPYLGRGHRWYGGGGGSSPRWPATDNHPEARIWDAPDAHVALVQRLVADYDGWAIALSADSLALYLSACPPGVRVGVWWKRNTMPSGARVHNRWEPVIFFIPADRRSREVEGFLETTDVLDAPKLNTGFVGAKPPAWTRWVLAVLGHSPEDSVDDIFNGSGAVSRAIDGLLPIPTSQDVAP